jgi:hypothetical protein
VLIAVCDGSRALPNTGDRATQLDTEELLDLPATVGRGRCRSKHTGSRRCSPCPSCASHPRWNRRWTTPWVISHRTGWLTSALQVLTWLGSTAVIIPLALATGLYFLIRRRDWRRWRC